MGDGRDVLDHGDLEAGGLQGADGRFAPGAGALDIDLDSLEAILLGMGGGGLGGRLRGERRGLRKPSPPAEAQDRALPFKSVMVTMVLLNEERIWAAPRSTSLRSRRLRVTLFSFGFAIAIFPP